MAGSSNRVCLQSWMPTSGRCTTAHALQQQVTSRLLHTLLPTAQQHSQAKHQQYLMLQLQELQHLRPHQ
jgi:hypothetical protein